MYVGQKKSANHTVTCVVWRKTLFQISIELSPDHTARFAQICKEYLFKT